MSATVDGNQKSGINSPVEEKVVEIPFFRGFYTSQVVQDFFHLCFFFRSNGNGNDGELLEAHMDARCSFATPKFVTVV